MDTRKEALPCNASLLWRVRLFNGPLLETPAGSTVRHFRSQRVGALLAYLALRLGQPCPREELYFALWPDDDDTAVVANRLRVSLASLRRQLEPPGVPFGSVLDVSDPGRVRLRPDTVWCDVIAFETAWKAGHFAEAAHLASGPLLPGYYDEWILTEQSRFDTICRELPEVAQPASLPEAAPVQVAHALPYHRLPLYLTRFFGREEAQRQLLARLSENRLVTVTGPGGIGKTRLVVETTRDLPYACAFVPLAELPAPDRVPEAVLQALAVLPRVEADLIQLLTEVLQDRSPFLLILDNAEHLLEPVAALSLRLLEAVPDLRLLVTSRQRLDLPGEALFRLPALEPPPYTATLERLMEFPAIALFLDRAKNARPDFILTSHHAEAIVEICRRLEGMPLALELAAARITAQSLTQIAEALSISLIGLKSRQRGLSERHRSLRAAIQTSYDLLSPELQRFFACLSVFQGAWTAEAAQAVTQCPVADEFLEDLVVRSLVVTVEEERGGPLRYAFLEALRQFAVEQLTEAEREQCAQRHAAHYLALAAQVREDDVRTLVPLDAAQENLMPALEWAGSYRDTVYWNGLVGALFYAFVRGLHRTAIPWIEEAMTDLTVIPDPTLRFRLRYAACLILPDIGRPAETERMAREMQADAEANDDPVGAAFATIILGYVANTRGDMETAVRLHREALAQARLLADSSLLQSALSHASGTLHDYGAWLGAETEAGDAILAEAVAQARELYALVPPNSRRVPLATLLLGSSLLLQNQVEEAYPFLKETQHACIAMGTTTEMMYTFIYESQIARARGAWEFATLRYGAFLGLQERMGYSLARAQAVRPAWISLHDDLQSALGQETFHALLQRGKQMPFALLAAETLPLNVSPSAR